ncbi:MAG: hypothetical protein V4697_03910 [Patescibacteria group bacterium]
MSSTASKNTEVPGWYIEFLSALVRQAPRPGELSRNTAQSWVINQERLKSVLRDRLCDHNDLTPKIPRTVTPKVKIDPIVRVDRSVRPSYPDWAEEVIHLDLETLGSTEYEISAVEQWFHDGQKDEKWIGGDKIYHYLKKTGTLKTCLGLRDLEEIQKKGLAFFRKYFDGKTVYAWKGIVRRLPNHLHIPCLHERDGVVFISWNYIGDVWNDEDPALRFL